MERRLVFRLNHVLMKRAQDILSAFLTDAGKMGIDERLIKRSVTEVSRDVSDAHPIFQ